MYPLLRITLLFNVFNYHLLCTLTRESLLITSAKLEVLAAERLRLMTLMSTSYANICRAWRTRQLGMI